MARLILGVMTLYLQGNKIEELGFFRQLSVEGKQLGVDVAVFTPDDVHEDEERVLAYLYDKNALRWRRQLIPIPGMIYDRCRYQKTPRYEQLLKFRSRYPDLLYLNKPMAQKWGVYQLLAKDDDMQRFLPETVPYGQASDLLRFLGKYQLVYMKPKDGTGGRGIIRIKRLGAGDFLLEGRDIRRRIIASVRLKPRQIPQRLGGWGLKDRYLIQQGIPLSLEDGRVHDYRLLIQKNGRGEWEVTGAAGRIGAARSITSNLHGGGAAVSMHKLLRARFASEEIAAGIEEDMDRLSILTVEVLEKQFGRLCEMALDIAVDPEGRVWLLEVNPKPAREVFRKIGDTETYRKAIRRPLEYALWLESDEQAK
jgi:hypothetical protein